MRIKLLIGLVLASTVFAPPLAWAADEKLISLAPSSRVGLLPAEVDSVVAGPDQRAWVISANPWTSSHETEVAAELVREFKQPQPHLKLSRPIFFEPGGRVWVQFIGWPPNSPPVLLGYNGKTFARHTLHPSLAAGNPTRLGSIRAIKAGETVFFADGRSILSYDGESWSTFEPPVPAEAAGFMPFVRQAGDVRFVPDIDERGLTALCGTRLLHLRARPDGNEHFDRMAAPICVTAAKDKASFGITAFAAATTRTLWTINPPDSRNKELELNLWRTPLAAAGAAGATTRPEAEPFPYRLSKIKALIPLPQGRALLVAAEIADQNGKGVTVASGDPAHPEPVPAKVLAIGADDSISIAGGDALRDVLIGHDFPIMFMPDFSTSTNYVAPQVQAAYERNTAIATRSISIIPVGDGRAWFTPHDTLVPALVDLKSLRIVERMSNPLVSQPLSRSADGVFFARGWHQIVACNPALPDTRVALPVKAQLDGMRTFMTGDGTIWIAGAKGAFSYFDGEAVHPIKSEPAQSLDHILVGEGALFVMNWGQWDLMTRTGMVTEPFLRGGGGGAGAPVAGTEKPHGLIDKHADLVVREFKRSIPQDFTGEFYIVQTDREGRVWTVGDQFQGFGIYSAKGEWIPQTMQLPEKITVYTEGKATVLEDAAPSGSMTPAYMAVNMNHVLMFVPVGDGSVFYLALGGKYGVTSATAFFVSLDGNRCKMTPAPIYVPDPYGRQPIYLPDRSLLLPTLNENQPVETSRRSTVEGRDPPANFNRACVRLSEKGVQWWKDNLPIACDADGEMWMAPVSTGGSKYFIRGKIGICDDYADLPADFLPSPATQFLPGAKGYVYAPTDAGMQELVCTDAAKRTYVCGRVFKFPGGPTATTFSRPLNCFCNSVNGRVTFYSVPAAATEPKK